MFDIESRETRDGSRKIYSIDITDYTNSITLKLIQQANDCEKIDDIKKGTALLVTGSVEYDKYDRENVMRPNTIFRAEMVGGRRYRQRKARRAASAYEHVRHGRHDPCRRAY